MPDLNNLFQAASTVGGSNSDPSWLVIDHDFRTIDIPANKKLLGVTSDERINYLDFKGPQYYEGSDLSTFSIRIVYLTPGARVIFMLLRKLMLSTANFGLPGKSDGMPVYTVVMSSLLCRLF